MLCPLRREHYSSPPCLRPKFWETLKFFFGLMNARRMLLLQARYSLLSGANFERICRSRFVGLPAMFWLTHTPTHTRKNCVEIIEEIGLEPVCMCCWKGPKTAENHPMNAPHTVCNQQVRGSSPFTSSSGTGRFPKTGRIACIQFHNLCGSSRVAKGGRL